MCMNSLPNYDSWKTRTPKDEWDEDDLTAEEIKELKGEAKYDELRDDA